MVLKGAFQVGVKMQYMYLGEVAVDPSAVLVLAVGVPEHGARARQVAHRFEGHPAEDAAERRAGVGSIEQAL